MKDPVNFLDDWFSSVNQYFQTDGVRDTDTAEKSPLRAEIFSLDQMEQLARQIARDHAISYEDSSEQLLKRLADNEELIVRVTGLLQNAVQQKTPIAPAGEWLLDNFYLIEEQIQLGKRYLPKGYSKGLPKLTNGPLAGHPRVYDIVVQIISHSDGHADIQSLNGFINAYQQVSELTLGELWAIPIMLRLALLENLRRVAARIAQDRIDADLAHEWADKLIKTSEQDAKNLVLTLADMARSNPPLRSAFIAEFFRKLQWKGGALALPLSWLEQQLAESSLTINAMVLMENQKQAADQVSITNSINSLRFLAKLDWREFVEAASTVEQTLRQDLNGTYPNMDFHTRDQYRHSIERIAKKSSLSESDIARIAIDLARQSAEKTPHDKRRAHVGYYLIGAGKDLTEERAKMSGGFFQLIGKELRRGGPTFYALGMLSMTALATTCLVWAALQAGLQGLSLAAWSVLAIICSSALASALTNFIASHLATPEPLPKMNFEHGIPDHARTLVVVPTLLSSVAQAEKLVEDLEVRFLANLDKNLMFALLTDFKDAPQQTLPGDEELIDFVRNRIEELNSRHNPADGDTFFLFHRPRLWNNNERVWMGYERKRGKLADLNQLLRGQGKDRFAVIVGNARSYSRVTYVITLDTDTQLPRDAAWKLVGLMEHPLNQPQYSEEKKRVVEGYGIIQPRIAISLHGATRSLYSRMYENDAGIDPYTRMTSDVYQDVFREGSFIGKGIYHIDAFEQSLRDRFPDNRILSHDLLEGSYARCGFASDVQFYEEYPSRYSTDVSRRHRWIRGDWQIGNWSMPFVPDRNERLHKNPVNALARWKIFDNLRRSTVPIAMMLLLMASWLYLPLAWIAMVAIITVSMLPTVVNLAWNILWKPREISTRQHAKNVAFDASKSFTQNLFTLMCLPYEAYMSADAIIRTHVRLLITRKRLLEWNPSAFAQQEHEDTVSTYSKMWINPSLAVVMTILILLQNPDALFIAAPFLVLWIFAPSVISWMSTPMPAALSTLDHYQKLFLRETARKTWAFFEDLVGPDDNWLPPDNLQQYPIPVIAHRTSPTNIGLALLANVSAYDFGYITTDTLLERTANTFVTLEKLERYAGHFYNWYDTQTLQILNPKYISTVDSGNLAGHLLTLRQALLAHIYEPVINPRFKEALYDTVRLLSNSLSETDKDGFKTFEEHFKDTTQLPLTTLRQVRNYLEDCQEKFTTWMADIRIGQHSGAAHWATALQSQLRDMLRQVWQYDVWIELQGLRHAEDTLELPEIPTLHEVSLFSGTMLDSLRFGTASKELIDHHAALQALSSQAKARIEQLETLALKCTILADIEYEFLYDKAQRLLSIGYNVDNHHRDGSYYDLLASEARLATFVAIAQGKLPQESWFALGRRLTSVGNAPTLISWSGSMFEYLMPLLVMPTYENTLLDKTYHGTVLKQIEYGRQNRIPWGISESCYNVVDAHLNYQYRAFGVPDLGFKRGLEKDLVVAPYATALALMVDPAVSCANLERLQSMGYDGRYGFYEAIDYTPARLPRSKAPVLIQTFMVHHVGMSLLALNYVLNNQPMQRRFAADPQFQTALLLLQERIPKTSSFYAGNISTEEIVHTPVEGEVRVITKTDTAVPEIQLLSNGTYHVMITHAGGGYSRWKDLALTRWREDATRDHWGTFCYLRNLDTNELWSNALQPTAKIPEHYEVVFSQGRVEFKRRDTDIETHTEVVVSPEDDIEIRRIHLTNHAKVERRIEVTSYAEVVMATTGADNAHPAFSNLFVQTEVLNSQNALLCTRRARSADERPPWMFHLMKVQKTTADYISYETDRYKFIGRGRTLTHPQVFDNQQPLSGSQGSVLDPIVSIRYVITIKPGETVSADIVTGMGDTRATVQTLIDKYQDGHLRDRAFELSWTHSQVVLRQINATEAQAQLYSRLAGSVIYANATLRAKPEILAKNSRGQSALWSYSISGDLPIVLLQIADPANIGLAKQLIQARAYWQLKGLTADLVILNEDSSGYRQVLQEEIQQFIAGSIGIPSSDRQGGVFVRSVDQIPMEDYILFQTVARVVLSDSRGSLHDQLKPSTGIRKSIPVLNPAVPYRPLAASTPTTADLQFFNGYGGFSKDGKEYVIHTRNKQTTPLPWVNVLANKKFGTIITESGPAYTWSENAHELRLTPWSNDPVTDQSGEALYIRDEATGRYWSPAPWPVSANTTYVTRHGFGYSVFEAEDNGIRSEVTTYLDLHEAVKFTVVKIRNSGPRSRKLTLTQYTEWVMGAQRAGTAMHVVTDADVESRAFTARNPYSSEFQNRIGFVYTDERTISYTCDRTEFLGRNGTLQRPEAMRRESLSGRVGAGLDPCIAIQVPMELRAGEERQVVLIMGAGNDIHDVRRLVKQFQGRNTAAQVLEHTKAFWQDTLGAITIDTPDPTLNLLTNGWLIYQVLSCRFWGRSGFYQSGGAYGFRDQLQDTLALLHSNPQLTREHILLSASRQFTEGDVQHWWHPPMNKGVRTLCSDDMLWLPYVTSRYVSLTGDEAVLHEIAGFIDGRPLHAHEESYYDQPVTSPKRTSIYDHCKLAIERAHRLGGHGLPLMGSGDWNDGMNMVGIEGRGESVWLGFFLYDVLMRFQPIATLFGDVDFARECQQRAEALKIALNKNAWDGDWYIRAYFDNGMMLGSSENDECRIDSISQSWSVLSGAGEPERSQKAMMSVNKHLVNREKAILQLLDPPFNNSSMDPGYIKGYVPGVRENGGQYTHAAIWMVMAFARLGDQQRTWELLRLINPIRHAQNQQDAEVYKVEPYVMAADVYGVEPHIGRGGWTWYTGSAGWMYQLILESFLGLKREGDTLWIEPCMPAEWKSFTLHYRFGKATYHISVFQSTQETGVITLDAQPLHNNRLVLKDDGKDHQVQVPWQPSLKETIEIG
jgi:cyclic beta-1,2-glucan synthetase